MTASEHRALLIGYGFAGAWIHDPLIRATPGIRVAGLVTRDRDRRALAHTRDVNVAVFDSAASAIASGEFNVAVVATPNDSHAELAGAAMAAGMAVVVDKPLTADVGSATALVEHARALGATLTVFHNRRWDGDYLTVRRLIDEGALGLVHTLVSRFDRWVPDHSPNWRDVDAAAGGGVLLDLGGHLIDQAILALGPVTSVHAVLDRDNPDRVSEDRFALQLAHASGVRSHLHASEQEGDPSMRFHVSGSNGSFVKRGKDIQEERLLAGELPVPGESGAEPPPRWGSLHRGDAGQPIETAVGDWTAFYRQLVSHLDGNGPVPVRPEEHIAVLEVVEAAHLSDRELRTITLDPDRAGAR
jgi:scyllo-inositol 2-dehydrogenase (NADP+)